MAPLEDRVVLFHAWEAVARRLADLREMPNPRNVDMTATLAFYEEVHARLQAMYLAAEAQS